MHCKWLNVIVCAQILCTIQKELTDVHVHEKTQSQQDQEHFGTTDMTAFPSSQPLPTSN